MTETDPLFTSHSCESLFGEAEVFTLEAEDEQGGAPTLLRVLFVDGGFQSATFLGEQRFEPVFAYYRILARAIDELQKRHEAADKPPIHMLLLGSGAYSIPKYVLTHYDSVSIDAVEIDPVVVELARTYFYVDELEETYASEKNPRLRSFVCDGRDFINQCPDCAYELIINDAFGGTEPVAELMESSHLRSAKRALRNGGIYALNAVVEDFENPESVLEGIRSALEALFAHVICIACTDDEFAGADNHLFFASDTPFQELEGFGLIE